MDSGDQNTPESTAREKKEGVTRLAAELLSVDAARGSNSYSSSVGGAVAALDVRGRSNSNNRRQNNSSNSSNNRGSSSNGDNRGSKNDASKLPEMRDEVSQNERCINCHCVSMSHLRIGTRASF